VLARGSEIAGFFGESDFRSRRKVRKPAADHAVSMKVDEASVGGLDTTRAAPSVELADPPVGGLAAALHIPAPLALVVFELAARGQKRVAQGDIRILVGAIGRMSVSDRDLPVRQRDDGPEIVEKALVPVTRRRLHGDVAADDPVNEPLEPRGELADASLERRGGIRVTKNDLKRKDHREALAGNARSFRTGKSRPAAQASTPQAASGCLSGTTPRVAS
jgi:hypothetical protein